MGRKRANSKVNIKIFLLLCAVVLAVAGFSAQQWWSKGMQAFDPAASGNLQVTVPSGTGTRGIATLLEEAGLIRSGDFFVIASRLQKLDGKLRAGTYTLSANMDLPAIFDRLLAGQDETRRFTIPEGYDIRRTAESLEEQGIVKKDDFYEALAAGSFDYRFLADIPAGENQLEGFLYPDTYEVYAGATATEIIEKMLDRFDQLFTDDQYLRAEELGLSIREAVTLASVIEREAVVPEDRPVIAGVFLNRLAIGMPLQSCATVQYILGEQKPVLSTTDTQIDSPYNTYRIVGLPPSPICSPGIASIEAALWPTETDYLYFLAKGDGSHVFSVTYEEHLQNKARYIDGR